MFTPPRGCSVKMIALVVCLIFLVLPKPTAKEISQHQIERDLYQKSMATALAKVFIKKSKKNQENISTAKELIARVKNPLRKKELTELYGKDLDMPLVGKLKKGIYQTRLYGVTIEMDLGGFYHNTIKINGKPYKFNNEGSAKKRAQELTQIFYKEMVMPSKKTTFHWTDIFISKAHAFFWDDDTPEYCENKNVNLPTEQLRACMARILTINAEGTVAIKVDFTDEDEREDFDYMLQILEKRLNSEDAGTCRNLNSVSRRQAENNLSDQTSLILHHMANSSGDGNEISETEAVKAIFGDIAQATDENDEDATTSNTCSQFIGNSLAVRVNITRRERVQRVCQKITNLANECNALYQKHQRHIDISRKYSTFKASDKEPLSETFGDGLGGGARSE